MTIATNYRFCSEWCSEYNRERGKKSNKTDSSEIYIISGGFFGILFQNHNWSLTFHFVFGWASAPSVGLEKVSIAWSRGGRLDDSM